MTEVTKLTELFDGFLRGRGPMGYSGSGVRLTCRDGTLRAGTCRVAVRVSAQEVWISPDALPRSAAQYRSRLRRAAAVAGFHVMETPKPPMPQVGFAPIPPVSVSDARLVVRALRDYAKAAMASPAEAERCRRLAEIYNAAAEGDRALAGGLYAALPPLGE